MLPKAISSNPAVQQAIRQFDSLSAREKSYLQIMAFAIVIALLYFVVWLPSSQFEKRSVAGLESARETLTYVKENLGAAKAASASQRSGNASIDSQTIVSTVSSVGKKYGIELKRFEPSGESRLRIWLENMPFNGMVQWLQTLDKDHGLSVAEISIDKDEKPGLINARLLIGP